VSDTVESPRGETPPDEVVDDSYDEGSVPRRRTGLVVSAVVALLAVVFVAVLATSDPASERRASSPLVGKTVPALAGETLTGGTFDIDDHGGRWVVVNFFATWCVPCIREHPELVAFDEAHRPVGDAAVVSILFSDDADKARDFFADNGGEWPVVVDEEGSAALDFGVPKVPETYLVDPGGRVRVKFTGGVTRDGLEAEIARFERARAEALAATDAGGGS
jgi:cytochrome c biogenesis protein CcmG/thiol:disulfide interchange protein DsbE